MVTWAEIDDLVQDIERAERRETYMDIAGEVKSMFVRVAKEGIHR